MHTEGNQRLRYYCFGRVGIIMLYLYLAITCIFFSIQFICKKFYQVRTDGSVNAGAWLTVVYAVLTVACFCYSGFPDALPPQIMWIAVGYSLCFVAVIVGGVPALKLGSVSAFTMFTLTGSISVTFLYGVIVLEEPLGAGKIIGFIMILASLFPSAIGGIKQEVGIVKTRTQKLLYVFFCAVVFFGNGLFGVFVKLAALHTEEINNSQFLFLTGLIRIAMAALVITGVRLAAKKPRSVMTGVGLANITPSRVSNADGKRAFVSFIAACGAGLLFGACNLAGNYFSISLATLMDSSSQFPIICAVVMVLSEIISAVFLKEKPNKETYISLGLALLGIGMYLLPI